MRTRHAETTAACADDVYHDVSACGERTRNASDSAAHTNDPEIDAVVIFEWRRSVTTRRCSPAEPYLDNLGESKAAVEVNEAARQVDVTLKLPRIFHRIWRTIRGRRPSPIGDGQPAHQPSDFFVRCGGLLVNIAAPSKHIEQHARDLFQVAGWQASVPPA